MKYGRSLILCGLVGGWLVVSLAAQNASGDQLPSAPSRSREEQRRAAQPPSPPPAEQPAPAPSTPSTATQDAGASKQPSAEPQEASAATGPGSPETPVPTAEQQLSAPTSSDGEPLETIRTTVDEVVVAFTVTDGDGKYVKNLTRDDFLILDDKKPPAAIRDFRSETNLPLRVGLLVDSSNSIRDRFRFEQDAAVEFLNQIVRPRSDRAFVLGFDSTYDNLVQDFTDSTELLARGVLKLRPGGGTALYDALYFSCRDKLMESGEGNAVRRVIILLADGEDNQSRVTRDEAIDMAQRAEVVIYAISTNVAGMRGKEDRELTRLAEGTGGRAFFPRKLEDVSNAFYELESELRSQYAVAYRPADLVRDGRFRPIEIRAVGGGKNLKVRARRGYFAPKE